MRLESQRVDLPIGSALSMFTRRTWLESSEVPGRISRDEMLMEIAHVISHRGTCPRAQVGAVVSRGARIISSGYVGAPAGQAHCSDVGQGCEIGAHGGCVRTVHAESNAIAFAARSGIPTEDSTLYCTISPCGECAKLIVNAGITRVVYHHPYRDPGGLGMLESAGVKVDKFPTKMV